MAYLYINLDNVEIDDKINFNKSQIKHLKQMKSGYLSSFKRSADPNYLEKVNHIDLLIEDLLEEIIELKTSKF